MTENFLAAVYSIIISFILVCFAAGLQVSAADVLVVNVGEVPFAAEYLGVRIVDGQPMVSLQGLESIFKVDVDYDEISRTVSIEMPETTNLTRWISMLESFLTPGSPEAAVDQWLKGVEFRNGAVQYAAMSADLRAKTKKEFDSVFWVTGASSPQLASYRILHSSKVSSDNYLFNVELSLDAQGKTIAKELVLLTIERDSIDPSAWLIAKITMNDPGALGITVGIEAGAVSSQMSE